MPKDKSYNMKMVYLMIMQENYFNVGEIAQELGISESRVEKIIRVLPEKAKKKREDLIKKKSKRR